MKKAGFGSWPPPSELKGVYRATTIMGIPMNTVITTLMTTATTITITIITAILTTKAITITTGMGLRWPRIKK
ncbi:MAG: hypothetical protein R3252_05535 [Robiginitalea sp.]|nr:hypothetical protein [Robiginitalea sp.]